MEPLPFLFLQLKWQIQRKKKFDTAIFLTTNGDDNDDEQFKTDLINKIVLEWIERKAGDHEVKMDRFVEKLAKQRFLNTNAIMVRKELMIAEQGPTTLGALSMTAPADLMGTVPTTLRAVPLLMIERGYL